MGIYDLVGPILRSLNPETAHGLAIKGLKKGWVPRQAPIVHPSLRQTLWGKTFGNPVGLAAGFDKSAEVLAPLLDQGFGFIEVGSVTPKPQAGNPKPRLFRLSQDQAVINRMGFNNDGLDAVVHRLKHRPSAGMIGVNLGKNKMQDDAIADYTAGAIAFAPYADYLVVNVSSPNTPGLRALQHKDQLFALLSAVLSARSQALLGTGRSVPLLLKVAPDLSDEDKADIASVALETGVDGLIVSNTTIERSNSLKSADRQETGGLSGAPLFEASTQVLKELAHELKGQLPLIGVGGIGSADQAYAKIRAGASLVQVYSALVYKGFDLVTEINTGLIERLEADGFKTISAAVGADL